MLDLYEATIKRQADRIIHDAGSGTKLSGGQGGDWEWAKLPIRDGGLGLQDLVLTAPVAHMASMGHVARRATSVSDGGHDRPATRVREWFDNDAEFKGQLERVAALVNLERGEGDAAAPHPLCPTLPALETMPSQKELSAPLYKKRRSSFSNGREATTPHKTRLGS